MNNNTYILEDRAILYINGLDAKDFLQNIISNDINKVTNESSCFASLLTPLGKFLYEFIVIKHKSGYFIDCEKSQSEEIFKQLNLYKIRSKVEILNLSNEFVVASFGYEKYLSIEGSKDILGFTFKYREDPIILDPRNKNLGARLIINLEKLYLSLKKFGLKEGESINHPWINKALERAQKRVEGRNFDIRKTLLKFDDVMNGQRKVIFEQRMKIIKSKNIDDVINSFLNDIINYFLNEKIIYEKEGKTDSFKSLIKPVMGKTIKDEEFINVNTLKNKEFENYVTCAPF